VTAHEEGDDVIDHGLTLVAAEGLYPAFHDAPAARAEWKR